MCRPIAVFQSVLCASVFLLGAAAAPAQVAARTIKVDCGAVLQKMRNDIAADPGRLVLAMEDALISSEACACPIVRNAVNLAGKEPKLIVELLIAAIHILPTSAATMTECVILEAPEASHILYNALAKELGEKSPEMLTAAEKIVPVTSEPVEDGGKSPVKTPPAGKESMPALPAVTASVRDEYEISDYPAVGVNGIYFTSRAIPAIPGKSLNQLIKLNVTTKKSPILRPVSAVTESSPG